MTKAKSRMKNSRSNLILNNTCCNTSFQLYENIPDTKSDINEY